MSCIKIFNAGGLSKCSESSCDKVLGEGSVSWPLSTGANSDSHLCLSVKSKLIQQSSVMPAFASADLLFGDD